jgi:hypothetical protein
MPLSLLKPTDLSAGRQLGTAMTHGPVSACAENFRPGRGGLPSMWPVPADPPRLLPGSKSRPADEPRTKDQEA